MAETNGRVTLAVIKKDLEYIAKDIDAIKVNVKEISKNTDVNENRITKLEGKTNNFAVFQSILSISVAAVAGFLGVRK